MTASTRPGLLRHTARFEGDDVWVNGQEWDSIEIERRVVLAAGPGTCLVNSAAENRFEILPLLGGNRREAAAGLGIIGIA